MKEINKLFAINLWFNLTIANEPSSYIDSVLFRSFGHVINFLNVAFIVDYFWSIYRDVFTARRKAHLLAAQCQDAKDHFTMVVVERMVL